MIEQCKPTAEQFLNSLGLEVNQQNIDRANVCIDIGWCKILEVESCIKRKGICCSVITQAGILMAKWACSITGSLGLGCSTAEDPTIKSRTSGKFSQTKADDAKGILSNPIVYNANLLLSGCLNPNSSLSLYAAESVSDDCQPKDCGCNCGGDFR